MDWPMTTTSALFLIPGCLHWRAGESFEATMYGCVTVSSILSDAIFIQPNTKMGHFTTRVDWVVATSALLVAVKKGWTKRPHVRPRINLLGGVYIAYLFLERGRKALKEGHFQKYRQYHMSWHFVLTMTGIWSALARSESS